LSKLTQSTNEWLLSFTAGRAFFDKKMKNSRDTERLYSMRLFDYCFNVGKNPDELIQLKLEGLQKPNTEKEFAAEDLLENFLRQNTFYRLKDGQKEEVPFTESSKPAMLAAIKSFYDSTRGRSLAKDTGDFLEVPEAKKRTPTVEDCVKLEEAMTTDRDKFLVWFLQSVEVRKGTVEKLKFGDLKPLNDKEVPYWLRVEAKRLKGSGKGKYKKAKHIGFLHYYAVRKLKAYKAELKAKGIAYDDNTPLFVSYKTTTYSKKGNALTNFFTIFVTASEKAFKDEKRFTAHDFRDCIPTVLKNKLKISGNLIKPLSSHVPTGIEAVYEGSNDSENTPDEDLLKTFKQCLPYLIPQTIPQLKTELDEQRQKLAKYEAMRPTLEILLKRVEMLEAQLEKS